jgi:hypothetical protein
MIYFTEMVLRTVVSCECSTIIISWYDTVLYLPVWGAAGCPASVHYRIDGGENWMTYVFVAAPSRFLKGGSNSVRRDRRLIRTQYSVTELVGLALTTT